MATDLKNFETRINSLVDEAIDSVADNILNDMGIKEEDDPNYVKYYEVYEDIQKYLIEKWEKEINDRFIKKQVDQVKEKVERYLKPGNDNGIISFRLIEEVKKAIEIFHEMGYETEHYYSDGYETIEYWKPGCKPELDHGV